MTPRQTSDERRDNVIAAAMQEFGERGYEAASTASIARRAGISQPYIYALFENKRELFLAAHSEAVRWIREAFVSAARDASDPEEALHKMGAAYVALVEDRYRLLFQLQAFAAAADPELRPEIARSFKSLVDDVRRVSGASPEQVTSFFACGMLINVAMALDLSEVLTPALELAQPEAA